jgi:MraZ protein
VVNSGKERQAMFFGEYIHTLDSKGRIIIPSKFRDELGDRFYVTQGLDECLYIFSEEKWEKLLSSLEQLPMASKEARNISRRLIARAAQLEPDKMGRVLIPATLRNIIGIDKDVSVVGAVGKIEIWKKEKWDEIIDLDEEHIDKCTEELIKAGIKF